MEAKEERGEKREGRYRQKKTSSASGGGTLDGEHTSHSKGHPYRFPLKGKFGKTFRPQLSPLLDDIYYRRAAAAVNPSPLGAKRKSID
jgi:hypothetical protein